MDDSKLYWEHVVEKKLICGGRTTTYSGASEFEYRNQKWVMHSVRKGALETSCMWIQPLSGGKISNVPILMILSEPEETSLSCGQYAEGFSNKMTVSLAEYAGLVSNKNSRRSFEVIVHLYTKVSAPALFASHDSLLYGLWRLQKTKSPTLDVMFQTNTGCVGAHSALLNQYQATTEDKATEKCVGDIAVLDFDLHVVTHFVEYLYTRHLSIDVVKNYPVEMWAFWDLALDEGFAKFTRILYHRKECGGSLCKV